MSRFERAVLISVLTLSLGLIGSRRDASAREALPKLEIPDAWRVCSQDSDCVIAGDACRSCSTLWVVHSRHKAELEKKDLELRKKAGFVPTCETCSTQHKKPICLAKRCEIRAN